MLQKNVNLPMGITPSGFYIFFANISIDISLLRSYFFKSRRDGISIESKINMLKAPEERYIHYSVT